MKNTVIAGFILLMFVSSIHAAVTPSPTPKKPTATPKPIERSIRYSTCDACGLCPVIDNSDNPTCEITKTAPDPNDPTKTITVNLVPGDWKSCVKCLYPSLVNPDPAKCETLLIINDTNLPKNPVPVGRQFTMLGCITAGSTVGFKNGAPSFVQAMLNVIFSLSGGIAFLYLMYGGFIYMTSQADAEQLNYGKRLITGAIVGLIITLGSVFLVNLIGSGILKIPGFSGISSP